MWRDRSRAKTANAKGSSHGWRTANVISAIDKENCAEIAVLHEAIRLSLDIRAVTPTEIAIMRINTAGCAMCAGTPICSKVCPEKMKIPSPTTKPTPTLTSPCLVVAVTNRPVWTSVAKQKTVIPADTIEICNTVRVAAHKATTSPVVESRE